MSLVLLDDIGQALIDAGVVQATSDAVDWFLFKGFMEDQPDRTVCLYETGGDAPDERLALDRPGFQVKVRGAAADYPAVRAKLQAIFTALHAQEGDIGGDYVFVYATHSGAIPMGRDEKRRPSLAQNYIVLKARPAS